MLISDEKQKSRLLMILLLQMMIDIKIIIYLLHAMVMHKQN